jgi:hypothetical protein
MITKLVSEILMENSVLFNRHRLGITCRLTTDETKVRYMDAHGLYSCQRQVQAHRECHLHGVPSDMTDVITMTLTIL